MDICRWHDLLQKNLETYQKELKKINMGIDIEKCKTMTISMKKENSLKL